MDIEDISLKLSRVEKDLHSLKARVKKEAWDVEVLEGWSPETILSRLRGRHDERLAKEQQEEAAAAAALRDCFVLRQELLDEQKTLQKHLSNLPPIAEKRSHLLRKKRAAMNRLSSPRITQLDEVISRMVQSRHRIKQLKSGIKNAEEVRRMIQCVKPLTSRGGGWVVADILFDGVLGLIATGVKYRRIDLAQALLLEIRHKLRNIDPYAASSLHIPDYSGPQRDANYLFDLAAFLPKPIGFVSSAADLVLQGKIIAQGAPSKNSLNHMYKRLGFAIQQWHQRIKSLEKDLGELRMHHDDLLESL